MTRRDVLLALILVVAAIGASLVCYPRLPSTIPIHWNFHGDVDGYAPKAWGLFLLPGIMAGMVGLFPLLAWLSPRRFEVGSFRATYSYLMLLIVALLAYLHGAMIWAAWSGDTDIRRVLFGGLFLFLALLGNVLGRVKRNFWIGVRTPWTLASERVWIDTHRFTARLFVAVGLAGLALVAAGAPAMAALALFAVSSLVPIVYSLVHYKGLARRGEV